jgi:type II secretory pathway component PulC
MKENISPEEKLLKLIRKGKKEEPSRIKQTAQILPLAKRGIKFSFSSLFEKFAPRLNLSKVIFAAFALSCLYLIISLIYPLIGLKKINLPKISVEKISEPKTELKNETKPFEFYQKGIENRRIFGGGTAAGESGLPSAGNINVDLAKDINLVGIISGENPQAIIEDKKTQKTYYVNKGQTIGEILVEDIQEGKIIVNYRGQRFELYL